MTPVPEALLRELAPQVLGAVVRRFRDFAAAEDAERPLLHAAEALAVADSGAPDDRAVEFSRHGHDAGVPF